MTNLDLVKRALAALTLLLVVGGLLGFFFWQPAAAETAVAPQEAPALEVAPLGTILQQDDQQAAQPPSDAACISCHSTTDATVTFESGETVSVHVDPNSLAASAHGMAADPLACTSCHDANAYQFPHASVAEVDVRSFEIAQSEACVRCHAPNHLTAHPGLESENPVICTDCHTSHDVQPVDYWYTLDATTVCADCHVERGVELTDQAALSEHIQAGLFSQTQQTSEFCMGCHAAPNQTMIFPNGDEVSITVDGTGLHDSVHGIDNEWQALECVDCHTSVVFPHEPKTAESAREYSIEQTQLCANCHETQHEDASVSVHAMALAEGNLNAAVCTDCHGFHDTPVPNEPRARIPETCEQCHSTIFNDYAISVHGHALLDEDNPDVPSCVDCHGVHNISDPTTASFRNRSPELCATCHANEEMMAQYGISTDVFDTYVADFHGTTVTIFESDDPNVETNKAVCYDCHGIHAILSPDDPENGIKENLLITCQKCHPDASSNFPDAWTGHHRPTLQDNPLLFLVNLFYAIVIPATVGFLGFLVATDLYRKVRGR
ncbi:MAG: cytochrome c3 family protein [Chloroflexota bacterium]